MGAADLRLTDRLPEDVRGDADVILLGAAAGGTKLRDLGKLAEAIHRQCAGPDTDGDDGFAGRSVALDTTFQGAGKLNGNLTPQCAAAMQAVLDALGKRRGPEDERTKGQRLHDALEDACRASSGPGACRSGPASRRRLCCTWIWTGSAACPALPKPRPHGRAGDRRAG